MEADNSIVPDFDKEKDNYLKISLQRLPSVQGGIIIYLNGYIDTYNSVFFQKQVTKVIDAGFKNLIFNCASLSYVSSTGIGTFTVFLKLLKPKGGDLVFLEMQPKVNEVLQLLGFSEFFTVKKTTEEAIACFSADKSTGTSLFPLVIGCLSCEKKLRATHAGKFRCPNCKAILAVSPSGIVSLG